MLDTSFRLKDFYQMQLELPFTLHGFMLSCFLQWRQLYTDGLSKTTWQMFGSMSHFGRAVNERVAVVVLHAFALSIVFSNLLWQILIIFITDVCLYTWLFLYIYHWKFWRKCSTGQRKNCSKAYITTIDVNYKNTWVIPWKNI